MTQAQAGRQAGKLTVVTVFALLQFHGFNVMHDLNSLQISSCVSVYIHIHTHDPPVFFVSSLR